MGYFKKHWFKILILLPFIPVGILVNSLDGFTGISAWLRFLVAFILITASLLLFFLGFYLELNKGNLKRKKIRFKIGNARFGLIEIGRVILSILIIVFLYATFNFANMSLRLGNVLNNITMPSNEQTERSYSLVTMSDFDVNNQGSYGRVGVLAVRGEAKELAIEEFLYEQNFIFNPIVTTVDSPFDLIDALYDGEVEAMIIESNFVQTFDVLEGFEDIEYETMVLDMFNVEIENVERAEINLGEPLSILLLGLNTDGELSTGQINVFMLLTINLENMSFTATSIPRDSYVPIPCHNYVQDKLSHTNIGGTACAVGAIEHMLDMEIPYHVKLNFTGFMDMIDILGGIEVDVPISFSEQDSRRRFGEHMIHLEAGPQRLNGEQALALSRHRNSFLTQDFARVENQQLVFEAMLREMFNEVNSVNDILPLLDVIGRNVVTNFTAHELTMLAQYMVEYLVSFRNLNIMDEIHFMNMVILGDTPTIPFRNVEMSVVIPWTRMISRARELMMINLGLNEPELNFTFTFDGFNRSSHRWLDPIQNHDNGIWSQSVIENEIPVEWVPMESAPHLEVAPPPAVEQTPEQTLPPVEQPPEQTLPPVEQPPEQNIPEQESSEQDDPELDIPSDDHDENDTTLD